MGFQEMKGPENLLIVRTDRIGDVVLSLPLAGIIKKKYPECRITFLVREYTKALAANHPFIDQIITLDTEADKILLFKNVKKIKKQNFDASIIVYPTFITALIIFLSGIKKRIGTGYRWYSPLFNTKIYEHRKHALKHELEYNVGLLKALGIDEEVTPSSVEFNLLPQKKAVVNANSVLMNEGITGPFIIIHPGSGGSSVDLPIPKFRELINLIDKEFSVPIVLTGSASERELCESLKISHNVKNFAGRFNLDELTAIIDRSFLFIANSTGPLHIAAALGKYTIGFYPRISACAAKRWGPYSNKTIIFEPEIDCSDCTREQCARLDCMNTIQITKVFAEIEKIYKFIVKNGELNV
jgi:ADP-heptose:LPS heptosyltransferase